MNRQRDPIRDQCGMPEHDYCAWCQKPMPNTLTAPGGSGSEEKQ